MKGEARATAARGRASALALLVASSQVAASRVRRAAGGAANASAVMGDHFWLAQYSGSFCTGRYQAFALRLEYMLQTNLPEGRTPEVVCSRLERNDTDSSYIVRSCPGSTASGCAADCGSCLQDMVRHFHLDSCAAGWKLHQGSAPEDCAGEGTDCAGLNQVDVGLSRWCSRWPVAGQSYSVTGSEELSASAGS